MSLHVKTYAPGTRVRTVAGEMQRVGHDYHAGDVGTVVETTDYQGAWTIWVLWDAWEVDPDRRGYKIGYSFEQLEVAEE